MLINCEIAHVLLEYDLHSKAMVQQMMKYQKEGNPMYRIHTFIVEELPQIHGVLKYKSQFYQIYHHDGIYEQKQYNEQQEVMGVIVYQGNLASIYLTREHIGTKEYLLTEYATVYFLLKNRDLIFIHGSSFLYQNHGVLLIADSGVGKSTHSGLWREYESITMVNDDKNYIGYKDGKLMLYGNPWSGKYLLDSNMEAPLTDLVYIYRGTENKIQGLSKKQSFLSLLPHVATTSFFLQKEVWDKMTTLLVEKTNSYALYCNISKEAVETLKHALEENK